MKNNYKKYIIISFYLIIISFLIYLIYINFKKPEYFIKQNQINKEVNKIKALKTLSDDDTDGDDLLDWEEHLYHTDLERVDTDNDGVSDYDEIKQDRDPLVYGVGNKDAIQKIKKTNNGVIGIKEQKKIFEKYKKELKEKEKKKYENFIKDRKEKKTAEQEYSLIIKKENQEIKKDLNFLAKIISQYDDRFDLKKNLVFYKFFLYLTGETKEKISNNDLNYITNTTNYNILISKKLDEVNFKNQDINNFKKELSVSYKNSGLNLKKLIEFYKNNKTNGVSDYIQKYSSAVNNIVNVRKKIYIYIKNRGIKFQNYEKGKIFDYSI